MRRVGGLGGEAFALLLSPLGISLQLEDLYSAALLINREDCVGDEGLAPEVTSSYHPPAQTPISPGSIFLTLGLDKSRIVHELPGPGSGSGGVGSCSSFLELGDALGYAMAFDDGTYEALDAEDADTRLLEFEMLPAFEARQVPAEKGASGKGQSEKANGAISFFERRDQRCL